jgi:NADH:ubiquinone oxidoreductase subunit 5 (subunit L)/multisubunit Na+/H+ antiporter MnhA subunit
VWDADKSYLGELLKKAEPHVAAVGKGHHAAHHAHTPALLLGLAGAALGVGVALVLHRNGVMVKQPDSAMRRALARRLYFDDVYDALVTKPVVALSGGSAAFDKAPDDTTRTTLDGAMTGVGEAVAAAGVGLKPVQSGRVRRYLAVLGLTLAGGLTMLVVFLR